VAAAAAAANIDKDGGECESTAAVLTDPADAAAVANTLVREEDEDKEDSSNAGDPNARAPDDAGLTLTAGDAGTDAKGGGVRCPAVDETVEGADDRDEADEVCDDTEDDSGEMGGDELEMSDEVVWEKWADDAEEEDAEDGDANERSEANGDTSCRAVCSA
jgi:hypothetical protein